VDNEATLTYQEFKLLRDGLMYRKTHPRCSFCGDDIPFGEERHFISFDGFGVYCRKPSCTNRITEIPWEDGLETKGRW
jgi:hypothetical protein